MVYFVSSLEMEIKYRYSLNNAQPYIGLYMDFIYA